MPWLGIVVEGLNLIFSVAMFLCLFVMNCLVLVINVLQTIFLVKNVHQ